jgi:hypothetical protein
MPASRASGIFRNVSRQPFHYRRRGFLLASLGAGSLLLLPRVAAAGEISGLKGDVTINGRKASLDTPVFSGDTVETGSNSQLIFKLNDDAFLMRANSSMRLEQKTQFDPLISGLRLLTGALAVVFGKGQKKIYAQSVTAGIRGTGVYLEVKPDVTYFCTCYGVVDLVAREESGIADKELVTSARHVSRYVYKDRQKGGSHIAEAPTINHTNEELAMLEALVGRSCPLMDGKKS